MPRASRATSRLGAVSPLALDILRLSAPADDIRVFRELVHQIWGSYPESVIDLQLNALRERGLIKSNGHPRTGWLTEKGQRVLQAELQAMSFHHQQ